MSDAQPQDHAPRGVDRVQRSVIIIVASLVILGIALVALAIVLASNPASTGPSVRILRDLLVIVMTLEIIVVGGAFTLLMIQLARLVNLIHNEVEPLIEAASDTVNTVRGTVAFLSKNLVEPVTAVSSTVRGVSKVVGDVDAIRKAAGVVMSAANAASETWAESASASPDVTDPSASTKKSSKVKTPVKPASRRITKSSKAIKENKHVKQ